MRLLFYINYKFVYENDFRRYRNLGRIHFIYIHFTLMATRIYNNNNNKWVISYILYR